MKKIIALSILTFSAFTMQAQVKYGVKAGANFSKFSGSDAKIEGVSSAYKPGFAGGLFAGYAISEALGVQLEALYSLEGTTYKAEGEKVHYNTSYVNIPVLAQYSHESGLYGETGPQIGFLTSAKLSANGNSVNYKEYFKSTNFSWCFGLGYKLPNGLGIGARYNLGLTSIAEEQEGEKADIKQSSFHVGLFYSLGGNK